MRNFDAHRWLPPPGPRSLSPELALDQLDGVARRVANIDRTSARSPFDLPLDLDSAGAELLGEGLEAAGLHGERDVARPGRPVRGNATSRLGGERRIEDQQHAAVVQSEDRGELVGFLE